MNATEARNRHFMLSALEALGIHFDEAQKLRRISMTLQRWFELECGDSNDYCSWTITRGIKTYIPKEKRVNGERYIFVHDENGKPFKEIHYHNENKPHYHETSDREKGARKRLAAIMTKYPHLIAYVQGDPRGCALYVLHKDMIEPGQNIDSVYTKGIAVG